MQTTATTGHVAHHDHGTRGEVAGGAELRRPDRNPDELARLLPRQKMRAQALPHRLRARGFHLPAETVTKRGRRLAGWGMSHPRKWCTRLCVDAAVFSSCLLRANRVAFMIITPAKVCMYYFKP